MKQLKNKLLYWAVIVVIVGIIVLTGCQAKGTDADAPDAGTTDEAAVDDVMDINEEPVVYEYHESGMENDKEESVYVLAAPDGTPNEITVNVALKNNGLDQKPTDKTFLTNLKNKEGDEEVTDLGDGRYEWENHGEDIHYEGTAEASATLPVSVKITYYLDGTEVEPASLAGADGRITMHFDYKNQTGSGDDFTPFFVISGMLLDGDCARNVSVTNGEVKYLDGDYLVYGMLLPGVQSALSLDTMELLEDEDVDLPEEMEVSFDATDFKLDFTATLYSNGILEEDNFDDITDKLDELADKFADASGDTADLKEKIGKLKNGGAKLRDGADSLSTGLSQLNDALARMAAADPEGYAALSAQVSQLTEGSKSLSAGISTYTSGVDQACESIDESTSSDGEDTDYETKAEELRTLSAKLKAMKTADQQYNNFSGLEDGKTGGVSFIIETGEISADTESN